MTFSNKVQRDKFLLKWCASHVSSGQWPSGCGFSSCFRFLLRSRQSCSRPRQPPRRTRTLVSKPKTMRLQNRRLVRARLKPSVLMRPQMAKLNVPYLMHQLLRPRRLHKIRFKQIYFIFLQINKEEFSIGFFVEKYLL